MTGEVVEVVHVSATDPILQHKLLVMGIVPGSSLRVLRRGPFGSPINIKVLGSVVSLRKSEARAVAVTRS